MPIRCTSTTAGEVSDLHLGEALVAQDAGVGDQHVDAAPLGHGALDHGGDAGIVGDRGAVGDGFAAGLGDLRHDRLGRRRRSARAVERAAQIVDHDLRAAPRELERVAAAQAAAGAGDDDDLAVEANVRAHLKSPFAEV